MIIHRVWHFSGEKHIPPQLRETPVELSECDLEALTRVYAVMLYRDPYRTDPKKELILALDEHQGRFRAR